MCRCATHKLRPDSGKTRRIPCRSIEILLCQLRRKGPEHPRAENAKPGRQILGHPGSGIGMEFPHRLQFQRCETRNERSSESVRGSDEIERVTSMVGPEPKQRNGTGGGGAVQLRAWPSCLSTWKRLRLLDLQRQLPQDTTQRTGRGSRITMR